MTPKYSTVLLIQSAKDVKILWEDLNNMHKESEKFYTSNEALHMYRKKNSEWDLKVIASLDPWPSKQGIRSKQTFFSIETQVLDYMVCISAYTYLWKPHVRSLCYRMCRHGWPEIIQRLKILLHHDKLNVWATVSGKVWGVRYWDETIQTG